MSHAPDHPRDPLGWNVAIALGFQDRIARDTGLTVRSEIFADRAYTEEGFLVSRKLEGAVIHDAEKAAERVVRMVEQGAIETISGQMLQTPIDSICVHSDTPAAVTIAARVRARLEESGVSIRAFSAAP